MRKAIMIAAAAGFSAARPRVEVAFVLDSTSTTAILCPFGKSHKTFDDEAELKYGSNPGQPEDNRVLSCGRMRT